MLKGQILSCLGGGDKGRLVIREPFLVLGIVLNAFHTSSHGNSESKAIAPGLRGEDMYPG